MDPDKFITAKVDSRLNAIYSLKCSLGLAQMGAFAFLFLRKCRLPVCKLNSCKDFIDQKICVASHMQT